jgi:hypothetical protein
MVVRPRHHSASDCQYIFTSCYHAAKGMDNWVDYWDRKLAYFNDHGGFSTDQFKHVREQRAVSQAAADRFHAEAIGWASR